jgi:hypothetical protein
MIPRKWKGAETGGGIKTGPGGTRGGTTEHCRVTWTCNGRKTDIVPEDTLGSYKRASDCVLSSVAIYSLY